MLSKLSILIHFFVILFVVTGSNVIHPLLILQIPFHRLLDAFLELQAGFPTQFALQLAGVNGIAHVVAGTVSNVRYQVHILAFFAAKQTINRINHHLDDVDVLPLVEAADVVGLGYLALMEDKVDGAGMVFYIQPVAHILALAIHRQRLAVTDVVDEQRNQLLGELIRTVVVRTVGHDGRHAVSVVKGTDKVVAAGLAGTVGTVRVVFGIFIEEVLAVG